MKKLHAYILSTVLVTIGAVIICLSVFVLPTIAREVEAFNPEVAYLKYPVLLGMYATVIPFIYAIVQTIQIIFKLENQQLHSHSIATALQQIKYCAFAIIVLYVAGFVMIASANAMPPVIALLGVIIITVTVVVAAGAGFLRNVVQRMVLEIH